MSKTRPALRFAPQRCDTRIMKLSASLAPALMIAAFVFTAGPMKAAGLQPVTLTWGGHSSTLAASPAPEAVPVAAKKVVPEWKPVAFGWTGLRPSLTTRQAAQV